MPALASPTLLPASPGPLLPVEGENAGASGRGESHDARGGSLTVQVDATKGCVGAGKNDERVWGSVASFQGLDGLADTARPYSLPSGGFTQRWAHEGVLTTARWPTGPKKTGYSVHRVMIGAREPLQPDGGMDGRSEARQASPARPYNAMWLGEYREGDGPAQWRHDLDLGVPAGLSPLRWYRSCDGYLCRC